MIAHDRLKPGDRMDDGTVYAGNSPETKALMFTTPDDVRLAPTFNDAADYAKLLNAENYLGHQDWRVPTKYELNELFIHRAAIGRFNITGSYPAGWYWSSTDYNEGLNARVQRFSDGLQGWNSKNGELSLRCVRG